MKTRNILQTFCLIVQICPGADQNCNGHGRCENHICVCEEGYSRENCEDETDDETDDGTDDENEDATEDETEVATEDETDVEGNDGIGSISLLYAPKQCTQWSEPLVWKLAEQSGLISN